MDLARVYAEIWKDAAPAYLVDIAVFCDSDDTHTASISYFAYAGLNGAKARIACRWRPSEVVKYGDENDSAVHRLVFGRVGPLYRWLRTRAASRAHRL